MKTITLKQFKQLGSINENHSVFRFNDKNKNSRKVKFSIITRKVIDSPLKEDWDNYNKIVEELNNIDNGGWTIRMGGLSMMQSIDIIKHYNLEN